MAVKILTDSTSYIDESLKRELDIKTVSLNILFDGENFKEMEIDNESFYKMMEEKGIPTSSQPSVNDLYKMMKEVVEKGDDLIGIFISSEMSGTYSSAVMVREMILEEYPEARIEIIDSRSNCMQLGFAVVTAARAAKEGKGIAEIKEVAEENIKRSRFLFIPHNLDYLKKGGRIGGASALIGNILKIIPILTVENGKTTILSKVRTKKNAVITMVDKLIEDMKNYGLKELVVHHINCYDEALELVNLIKEKISIDINISSIGPVIGTHVGPRAIGIVYYTERNIR
ncbi:hypothetical protein Q428_02660 [Fervidicella metallireducens AeB]|uniref:DegV domain-containing protein n=1 Tax=Fervidicella metallireducens AeB TaxID=1403537 RepID=A0A017RXP4_9CLOT|nr:DegV family protein [Fervidicella metallireducens]EYE89356.1 hypothetical protein Q428_02660 [Fervidicella metallireducens AeB]